MECHKEFLQAAEPFEVDEHIPSHTMLYPLEAGLFQKIYCG